MMLLYFRETGRSKSSRDETQRKTIHPALSQHDPISRAFPYPINCDVLSLEQDLLQVFDLRLNIG